MRRVSFALLALVLAFLHVFLPNHVQIDWPTLALLAIFLGLIFGPELSSFLPLIKRLRVGEAEIEMRESVIKLHKQVEQVEEVESLPVSKRPIIQSFQTAEWIQRPQEGSEESILALAARDREAAIVRLAMEIEKELSSRLLKAGLNPRTTIRETVEQLVSRQILSRQMAKAIIEFRDVRNKIIHPTSQGEVPPSVLVSALDSGLRILRLLRLQSTLGE